jgi:hypothetical protein
MVEAVTARAAALDLAHKLTVCTVPSGARHLLDQIPELN